MVVSEPLQTRAALIASSLHRGMWLQTPGEGSALVAKEYSELGNGRCRGSLPAGCLLGPIHCAECWERCEKGSYRLYVAVLVPSSLPEFRGRLSWVNMWCSYNPKHPRSRYGVVFLRSVDTTAWRANGWYDVFLDDGIVQEHYGRET